MDNILGNQSLARELSKGEREFAEALFAIFGQGIHDFAKVALALEERGVSPLSGESGTWTVEMLERELRSINESLDRAYVQGLPHGAGL